MKFEFDDRDRVLGPDYSLNMVADEYPWNESENVLFSYQDGCVMGVHRVSLREASSCFRCGASNKVRACYLGKYDDRPSEEMVDIVDAKTIGLCDACYAQAESWSAPIDAAWCAMQPEEEE